MSLKPEPTEVARQLFAALNEARWSVAIELCDADSLSRSRDHELASAIAWIENRDARREARQRGGMFGYSTDGMLTPERLERHANVPLRSAPGKPTIGDLARLSHAAFAEFCLKLRNSPQDAESDANGRSIGTVIGSVLDGPAVAHVLFRWVGGGFKYDDPYTVELLRLRSGTSGWRVELDANLHTSLFAMPLVFYFGDTPGFDTDSTDSV